MIHFEPLKDLKGIDKICELCLTGPIAGSQFYPTVYSTSQTRSVSLPIRNAFRQLKNSYEVVCEISACHNWQFHLFKESPAGVFTLISTNTDRITADKICVTVYSLADFDWNTTFWNIRYDRNLGETNQVVSIFCFDRSKITNVSLYWGNS